MNWSSSPGRTSIRAISSTMARSLAERPVTSRGAPLGRAPSKEHNRGLGGGEYPSAATPSSRLSPVSYRDRPGVVGPEAARRRPPGGRDLRLLTSASSREGRERYALGRDPHRGRAGAAPGG